MNKSADFLFLSEATLKIFHAVPLKLPVELSHSCLIAKLCLTLLRPHGLQPSRLRCPCDFPAKNTGVGCHSLLQGIFLTQGSDPCLLHWQADSLPLSHLGSPQPQLSKIIICSLLCSVLDSFPSVLGTSGKETACQCRRHKRCRFDPWVGKIPGGGHGNPLQYSCLENPHGQRSLAAGLRSGLCPEGHKESRHERSSLALMPSVFLSTSLTGASRSPLRSTVCTQTLLLEEDNLRHHFILVSKLQRLLIK